MPRPLPRLNGEAEMKAITTLLTTSLFAASAFAGSGTSDIYSGFASNNPDLSQWQPSAGLAASGPAVAYTGPGANDIYGGFAKTNSDLFPWQPSADMEMTGVQPAVGDAPYDLGGSQERGMFKSESSGNGKADRVDAYGEFVGPDLPRSF